MDFYHSYYLLGRIIEHIYCRSLQRAINRKSPLNYIHTYIHTYLIDCSPWGLFRANETQSTKRQNTTTTVKNPNWPEANQLAIYKCSREVEPGTTRNKFNEWSERVLNLGSPDLKASALTTGPHCLAYRNIHHL